MLTLGPILLDFAHMTMSFTYKTTAVQLKGLAHFAIALVDDNEKNSFSKAQMKGIWLQFMSNTTSASTDPIPIEILILL